ncbi:MAG TPA: hypothetical protein VFJ13_10540 [Paracoccaceae bacterium]|nr:hypothetical protein [Paracoccaceae bacterium]
MSGTHAHTAKAQADLQQADAQHGKPHIPPGHVETERPVRRLGTHITAPVIGVGLAIVAAVAAVAFLAT